MQRPFPDNIPESEKRRLIGKELSRFLLVRDRDGMRQAIDWAERVIGKYAAALVSCDSYLCHEPYLTECQASIRILSKVLKDVEEGTITETARAAMFEAKTWL